MKNFDKIFVTAIVVVFGLASCSQEAIKTIERESVTVYFGATADIAATKATLTTNDEAVFNSAWEANDRISVNYTTPAGESAVVSTEWTGESFKTTIPAGHGNWSYQAYYPVSVENSDVDFGGTRTQYGNNYNSAYDIMTCERFNVSGADAGKNADGSNVVFKMNRQTAITYFHISEGPADEAIVSAKIRIEGGNIAASTAGLKDFTFAPKADLSEITMTFPEQAPKASDFQLWFNVLPTKYTKITLEVETATRTLNISRSGAGEYVAANLYKVVKSIPADKWVAKVPAKFEVAAPADNADIKLDHNPQNLAFEWEAAETQTYKAVFSLAEELSSPVELELNNTGKAEISHKQLDEVMEKLGVKAYHSAKIYWAVRASNAAGGEAISKVRSMQVQRIMAFTDPRDGEVYRVMRLVNKSGEETIWMADNLRATKYSDGTPVAEGSYRFSVPAADADDYHKEWCRLRGAYYNWDAVVRDTDAVAAGKQVQGIAPDGWHIATRDDWTFLINNQLNNSQPAKYMRSSMYWDKSVEALGCDNSCGLNIVAAGYIWTITVASHPINVETTNAYFWTPALSEDGGAFVYEFRNGDNAIPTWSAPKERGYSVRCVLNNLD